MKKLDIYFLCGNNPYIKPISGDQITEISIMRCLSRFHNVYYNNDLIDISKDDATATYGKQKKEIDIPNRNYDILWVRNNDKILFSKNGYKVRCGSPYISEAYKNSDLVLTYSNSWKNKLLRYNHQSEPSNGLYPEGKIIIPKNIMTVYQSVKNLFFNRISLDERNNIRKILCGIDSKTNKISSNYQNPDFIIGYFGRISTTCYPEILLNIFPRILAKYPKLNIKLIFCGRKIHFKQKIITNNPNIIINDKGIDHNDIYKYIQSVDLISSNYDNATANWGGCMHILEAIVCQTPIICGNFDVRIEQLGPDYPLFWDKDADIYTKETQCFDLICQVIENKNNILGNIKKDFETRGKMYSEEYLSRKLNYEIQLFFYSMKPYIMTNFVECTKPLYVKKVNNKNINLTILKSYQCITLIREMISLLICSNDVDSAILIHNYLKKYHFIEYKSGLYLVNFNEFKPYDQQVQFNNKWVSGMLQGEALLVYSILFLKTKWYEFLSICQQIFQTFLNFTEKSFNPENNFCFVIKENNYNWIEEYPIQEGSRSLIGFLFAMQGLYLYKDIDSRNNDKIKNTIAEFEKTIVNNLERFNVKDDISYHCLKPKMQKILYHKIQSRQLLLVSYLSEIEENKNIFYEFYKKFCLNHHIDDNDDFININLANNLTLKRLVTI